MTSTLLAESIREPEFTVPQQQRQLGSTALKHEAQLRSKRCFEETRIGWTIFLNNKADDIVNFNMAKTDFEAASEVNLIREAVYLYFEDEIPESHQSVLSQDFIRFEDNQAVA